MLIPFDNLFFAPSAGWATVSPLIFFMYIMLNMKSLGRALGKEKKLLICFFLIFLPQPLLLAVNGVRWESFTDNLQTFALGISFYFALIIRYDICKSDFNKDGQILYRAYVVSFVYGILRLVAMNFIPVLLNMFTLIEKRPYPRLAFSFTEPSFISMHAIGVIFLFSYLISDRILAKKMIRIGLAFCLVSLFARSSARCVFDILVLAVIYIIRSMLVERRHIIRNTVLLVTAGVGLPVVINIFPRVQGVLDKGFNFDSSGASRWFRVNATIIGFIKEPLQTLVGYGMGNMVIPFKTGFIEALAAFNNSYTAEVNALRNAESISSLFNLPIKIISDFGMIPTIIAILFVFIQSHKNKVDIFVIIMTLWLYMQFDSYAFYSLWILFYLVSRYDSEKHGESYFPLVSRFSHNSKRNKKYT